jgi:hypothetical protein
MHRRQAEQIGPDGERIVARHQREGIVGHRRIQVLAGAADALMHHPHPFVVGVALDAGFIVRCDIRRIQRVERRGEGAATREKRISWHRTAACEVGRTPQIGAPLDQVVRRLRARRHRQQPQREPQYRFHADASCPCPKGMRRSRFPVEAPLPRAADRAGAGQIESPPICRRRARGPARPHVRRQQFQRVVRSERFRGFAS